MRLPIEQDIKWTQGFFGNLDSLYIPGNYSDHKLVLEGKTSESLSAAATVQKANAAAGGSDSLLASSYAAGRTKITPLAYYSDLQNVTNDYLYYTLVAENDSERVILAVGKIIITKTVVADADAVTYSLDLAKRWIFKLESDGTMTDILTAANFSGTLSASLSGDVITITSTADEVTDSWQVAKTTGVSIGYKVDVNTYKIQLIPAWDSDYGHVIIELYKIEGA